MHGHSGSNRARREKTRKAVRQVATQIEWSASGCKSFGQLDEPGAKERRETRHVRRRESEDWESCEEAMGEVSGASEEGSRIGFVIFIVLLALPRYPARTPMSFQP
jgi:hypothetical protein